jgi:hypothetical protein
MVYGTLSDYLTGEELTDTDDERYRQQLARMMVEERGFAREELEPRLFIESIINSQYVKSTIELTVRLNGRRLMIIRYGPGSLVTRERAAIAAARLLDQDHRIPLAVVTNCRDAELLETLTGKVLATGMEGIPTREHLIHLLTGQAMEPFADEERRDREMRILNAFDLEVCCRGDSCRPSPEQR